MEVFRTFERSEKKTSIAMGYFDGVHRAHMSVINKAVSLKATTEFIPSVLTFSMDEVAPNKIEVKTILTDETKLELMARFGVKRVYMPLFSEIAHISAESFFNDIIMDKLNAGAVVCGYDYSFGYEKKGNTDMLMELCEQNNIEFHMINPMQTHGEIISSTAIRKLITQGRMKEANDMLGYVYFIKSKVCHGQKFGRKIGFPTINQYFDENQVIPKRGVYNTTVYIENRIFKGVTNIGVKPTVSDENIVASETYIIGFDGDLYDKVIVVAFNDFLRDELRFETIDELKSAICGDIDKIFHR